MRSAARQVVLTKKWSPFSLGLSLFFDGANAYSDTGSTPAVAFDTVRQWNDRGSLKNNLGQATGGARPQFLTGMYGAGLPCIRFAGAQYLDTATLAAALPQPTTVFAVWRRTSSNTGGRTLFDTNTVTNEQALLTFNGLYRQYSGIEVAAVTPDQLISRTVSLFNGGSSYLRRNGTQILSGNMGAMTLPQLRVGANPSPTSYLLGDILLLGIVCRALSATELRKLEEWMSLYARASLPTSSAYLMPSFRTADQVFRLWASPEAATFCEVLGISYTPTSGVFRDPTLIKLSGTYWLAHTIGDSSTATTVFAVASSMEGINWTPVAQVDCSAASGNTSASRTWAPEWFVDTDGSVHVLLSASTTGDVDTGFQIYETHPTNASYTTWSAPVAITGGLPNNMIDAFMVSPTISPNGQYCLWYKNENTKYIEVATSTSLLSGYTVLKSGNWLGTANEYEGPSLLYRGGSWRLFADHYTGSGTRGISYSDSDDNWASWSAMTPITSGGVVLNHGTVIPAS